MNDIIHTQRLDLIPLSPAVLRAALDKDHSTMERLLGVSVPADWEIRREFLELRIRQLEADPTLQPWLIRGICLHDEGLLVGDIGFHSEPVAAPLPSAKSLELGYCVLEAWRRRGIAREAVQALIQWAFDTHAVRRFVLSISPENHPSQSLAVKLGFRKIGSRIDELDGPEDIFERIL